MTKTVFHLGLILPSLVSLYFAKCLPRRFLSYKVFFYSWRWIHKRFPRLSELLRGSSAPSGWFFLWFWVVSLLPCFVWYSAEDEPSSSALHGSSVQLSLLQHRAWWPHKASASGTPISISWTRGNQWLHLGHPFPSGGLETLSRWQAGKIIGLALLSPLSVLIFLNGLMSSIWKWLLHIYCLFCLAVLDHNYST